MEVVSGVASTVALVEVAGKIGLLCAKYISEVRGAKDEAERMMKETTVSCGLLNDVESMLNGPAGIKLKTSQALQDALCDGKQVLESLKSDLERGLKRNEAPKKKSVLGKLTKLLKVEDLKWPFQRKEVEEIIKRLRKLNAAITLALQIDGVSIMAARDQRTNLEGLTAVKDAIFGSLEDQHEPQCLPETRVEVLDSIEGWIKGPRDSCIFWLRGMAGTGKSTVARSVAAHLKNKGQLGGSFFFKRSQAQRNNASKFFPTIAYSLATHLPVLMPHISKAIEDNPDAPGSSFKEQFEKLIFTPLSQVTFTSTVVVVIDALDECENEREIPLVLDFLGRLSELDTVDVRIFVTSRPDHAPTTGFQKLSKNNIYYHDLALHDVDLATIKHDIRVFLTHEFAQIRTRRYDEVPESWPEEGIIQQLVGIAEPLFISAATICRFVDDKHFSPTKRLNSILTACYKTVGVYPIYLTVFEQMLANMDDMNPDDREIILEETRKIINAVVILEVPLSRQSLSELIGMDEETIHYRLRPFHSILRVPTDADTPIQTFHLSFRDFLLDPKQKSGNPFAMDEEAIHENMTIDCIALLSKTLRRNICNLKAPGTFRSEIDSVLRQHCIPAEVAYACQFWAYHVRKSQRPLEDDGTVHKFLRVHLLHWLEATSILGIFSNNIYLIKDLQLIVSNDGKAINLLEFLQDIERFLGSNQFIISKAPLQTYFSALLFSPEKSIVKTLFSPNCLGWVRKAPEVEERWGPLLHTIEAHGHVFSLDFSSDGKWLISAVDSKVKIWDIISGALIQVLEGYSEDVRSVAFSPTGRLVASGSANTAILWDATSGSPIRILESHNKDSPTCFLEVAFSPDGRHLASSSKGGAIKIWNPISGTLVQTFRDGVNLKTLAFSPDSKQIITTSNWEVEIWSTYSGTLLQTYKYHNDIDSFPLSSNTFSPDFKQLAFSSGFSGAVKLWDMASGELTMEFKGHTDYITAMTFSPNGKQLLSVSDNKIILWDTASGELLRRFQDSHSGSRIWRAAFSPDGTQIALATEGILNLWEIAGHEDTAYEIRKAPGPQFDDVGSTALSPDSQRLALARSGVVEIWDTLSRTTIKTITTGLVSSNYKDDSITQMAFSPDGEQLAFSTPTKKIHLWNIEMGELVHIFECDLHSKFIHSLRFSSDGRKLVSQSVPTTMAWDVVSGNLLQVLKGRFHMFMIAISPDGTRIAFEDLSLNLCDLGSEMPIELTKLPRTAINPIAFSPDGKRLIGADSLWDIASRTVVKTNLGLRHHTYTGIKSQLPVISFSKNGDALETDTGSIDLAHLITGGDPKYPLTGKLHYFCDRDGFLRLNGNILLWFPSEYRPRFMGRIGSLRVIFTHSHRLFHLEIDEDLVRKFWS